MIPRQDFRAFVVNTFLKLEIITSRLCAKQCFCCVFSIMDQCLLLWNIRKHADFTLWVLLSTATEGNKTVQGLLMLKCYNKSILVLKCVCSLFQTGSLLSSHVTEKPLIHLFFKFLQFKIYLKSDPSSKWGCAFVLILPGVGRKSMKSLIVNQTQDSNLWVYVWTSGFMDFLAVKRQNLW